jgi:predicted AlkP superfamily pyrophosphatase or phosphodiesterase
MFDCITVVLADGLRPDAVTPTRMPSLYSLGVQNVRVSQAVTVRPSTTVAALASLATGVSPQSHRLIEPGLRFLSGLRELRPIGRELQRSGITTTVVSSVMDPSSRTIARVMGNAAGMGKLISKGATTRETATVAAGLLADRGSGFTMVYLSACDRAGHGHGWMSEQYLDAAAEIDVAVGLLASSCTNQLFLVLSDHGGGGVDPRDHDAPHRLNDRITMVLAGPGVRKRHRVTRPVSILDVPPTILWAMGLPVPAVYEGRVLSEGFVRQPVGGSAR